MGGGGRSAADPALDVEEAHVLGVLLDEVATGLDVVAHLGHPVDSRRDVEFKLYSTGHGHYVGEAAAPVGQWRLDLDLYQDGNRVYRSRNRISVQ